MIKEFRGKTRWLSNFQASPIEFRGKIYNTVEHFYQAYKATNEYDHEFIRTSPTPAEAKKRSKQIPLRQNWDQLKLPVMWTGLQLKFSIPELRDQLLGTGNQNLVEGNRWKDTFWGQDLDTFEGENHLGRMLMQLRTNIRTNTHVPYHGSTLEFTLLSRKDTKDV